MSPREARKGLVDWQQPIKPGTPAKESGIYRPSKGGGAEVAISKEDRLPPTEKGGGWIMKTPTKKGK